MAKKKKKGIASSLKSSVAQTPVVQQQAPKTIQSNVSTGGIGSSFRSSSQNYATTKKETATQKAERERSERMRKGISSIVRSQFKQKVSQPATVQKKLFQNVSNALEPLKSKTFKIGSVGVKNFQVPTTMLKTGGTGVGNYGFKTAVRQTLAPVKQDIKNNYYDAVRTVGMKGSINERRIYRPLSQRDENGQVSTNQRRLENAARGGNRKAQVEAEMGRTKAQTLSGHTYDQIVNAELNKKGLMGQDYILRTQDPTEEALNYRKQYGFDEEAKQALLDRINKNNGLNFGLDESYRAAKSEDTLKRHYDIDLTPEEQEQIDDARSSAGYMFGNMLGQGSQFAMTAPFSGLVEGGLMAKAGLKGGRAAVKTTKDALKYAGARIGADQIVSAPINVLDALKEDNIKDVIKRFGLNTGMDIIFSGIIEIPALRKNFRFVRAMQANDAANAMEAGAEKTAAKLAAQKQLSKAIDSMDEVTKRSIVAQLSETAENARIQRAQDFRNEAELMFQDGYIASRDSVNASIEHGIADNESYEWQVAYDAARRNGSTEEDAIEFADASLEDAIANGRVRQPRKNVTTENDALLNASTERPKERDVLLDAYNERPEEDVLLNASKARDDTGLIGANDRLAKDPSERGTYGRQVVERDKRRLRNQDEIRYLRDRERPKNAYEEDLWDEEFDRVYRENYGQADAESKATAAADRAVNIDRETRLRKAKERIKAKRNAERERARASAKEAKEKTRGQQLVDKVVAEKQAKQVVEETAETASNTVDTRSVDNIVDSVMNNDHVRYSSDDLQSARETLEDALIDNPMNVDAEDALDAIDHELFRRGEEPKWSVLEPNRDTETAMLAPEKFEQPKVEATAEKVEQPKQKTEKAEQPKEKEINWEKEEKKYKKKDNDTLLKDKEKIRKQVSNGKMPKSEGDRRIGIIDNVMASKKQRDLAREKIVKAEAEGWGDPEVPKHPHGAPKKNPQGQDTSQAMDSMLRESQTKFSKETREEGRRRVTEGEGGVKHKWSFDKNLDNAKARYDSNPVEFTDSLVNDALNNVNKGNLPKSRNTFVEFMDDAEYLMKRNEKTMEGLSKDSDEYKRLLKQNADLQEALLQSGSQVGGGLRRYQSFADSHEAVKNAIIDRNLERLEKEFEKRLGKINVTELDFPDEYRNAILNADNAKEAQEAWARASVYIYNQIPASLKEKIDFVRINAMLLNPTTHIRNILGNAFFVPLRETKNIVGTAMEIGAEKLHLIDKSQRTKAVRLVKENMDYAQEVLDNIGDAIRGNSRYFENIPQNRPMEGVEHFKDLFNPNILKSKTFMAGRANANPVVNGIRKFMDGVGDANSWLLEHEDIKFFNPAFKKQMSRTMSARGLSVDDLVKDAALRDEIIEVATEEALRATYRDESALAKAISGMKNPPKNAGVIRKGIGIALDSILPFTKTPINIMRRAFDYSPIGFIKGNVNFWRGVATKDSKLIIKGIDQFASTVPGTGVAALGFLWAKHDGLNGKFGDDDADQFMKDLGKQNFSCVFHLDGDREISFTLDWLAPGCIPLFTGVKAYEIAKENGFSDIDWWEVADLLEQVLEPTTEMSVMQGVKDNIEMFKKESGGGILQGGVAVAINTGLNYINQIIHPTIVSKVARQIDPIRRDTSSTADSSTKRIVEKWMNKQIAGTPVLSKTLKPYTNAWNEEQRNTYSKNPALRALENFVSPSYIKEYNPDSVDKKMMELGVFPEKNWKGEIEFEGSKLKLDKDEIEEYNKEYGGLKKELNKLFNSDEFKNASFSEQKKLVNNLDADQNEKAKRNILLKRGTDPWRVYGEALPDSKKKHMRDAKNVGLSAEDAYKYATSTEWDRNGNGSAYKSEMVLWLNKQDLTDEQRAVIFSMHQTSNNPYTDGTAHTEDWETKYEKDVASSDKRTDTNNNKKFNAAIPWEEGSLAAKLFNKSVIERAGKTDSGSSGSKGKSGKRGRSGRSRGSGGKSSTGSAYVKSKIKPIKTQLDLDKIYKENQALPSSQKIKKVDLDAIFKTGKGKIKTPTYREITSSNLSKSQKKALLKMIQKKLNV